MKKMRKLIPALAMLLVSAVMMSTASFAWFSMNTDVTATGISVKATSSGGLVIATADSELTTVTASTFTSSAFGITKSFDWSNHKGLTNPTINPTSLNTATGKWYTATAESPLAHTGSGYSEVTTNFANYYYRTQCVVKSLSETAGTLYLDAITVTGSNSLAVLDSSLRVAIKVGTTWTVFAPKRLASDTSFTYKCYNGTQVVDATVNAASTAAGEYTNNVSIGSLEAASSTQVPTLVDIYVYFEGEDPACMSANVQNLADLEISIKFSSAATDAV